MKHAAALLLTLRLCLGLTVFAGAAEFSDVPASYMFHDVISECVSRGILSGYEDGTFRPAGSVTRAQLCVMLVRAFYPGEERAYAGYGSFGWYCPSAALLDARGAMPYGETHWTQPSVMNQAVSRRDMALFLCRAAEDKGLTVSQAEKDAAQARIADYADLGAPYEEAVKTVFALGILTGYAGNTFEGRRSMSRGQAAAVISRMARRLEGKAAWPEAEPAPAALTNGRAVTEENVLELLRELKETYPEGTDFSPGYPLGNDSPVRQVTFPYERAADPRNHTSNVIGCGGWATLLSDAIFGQAGFPLRKTALKDARPGDIMIQLDGNGRLVHVAMLSARPAGKDGRTVFSVTEAASDDRDVYHLYWEVEYTWQSGGKYRYDIFTRYPA